MSIKQKIAQDQILSQIQEKFEAQTEGLERAEILAKFEAQTRKGLEKYGQTVADNDLTVVEWIDHASEELIDYIVYLECLKAKLSQMISEDVLVAILLIDIQLIDQAIEEVIVQIVYLEGLKAGLLKYES